MTLNAFDKFVEEQMKSPSFSEVYQHEGGKIAAMDRLMRANPGKPVPKFQVSYYLEEKHVDNKGKEKTKYVHFRGEPVGLASNLNSGTIDYAVWSDQLDQWSYTLYPWSGDRGNKTATEDMIIPIHEWIHDKLTDKEVHLCEYISQRNNIPNTTSIVSHYHSLLSGRVADVYAVIHNLKKLLHEYQNGF